MIEKNFLAARFAADRGRLRAVAYRLLGSLTEAEDAVQETWLRLDRTEAAGIDNLSGWLTTVVSRVCLDMLRSRKARAEDEVDDGQASAAPDPEAELLMAEAVGLAVLAVMERLGPAERVAFVLHDMFDMPFGEIAAILDRGIEATRQLASRARRRVRGNPVVSEGALAGQRQVIDAFLAAARANDLAGLLALLDPGIVFTADLGPVRERIGADAVARSFAGRAQGARAGLIDGQFGAFVVPGGRLLLELRMTIAAGRITAIEAIGNKTRLDRMELGTGAAA